MKRITFLLLLLFSLNMVFSGFVGPTPKYGDYEPVYMKRSDLENSVAYKDQARKMVHPGKIYYKSPYIYINERYKGVHVINNSDPANPVKEGFITAPGCIDMAVKDDVLYLDNSVDLVAFSLSRKEVTKRVKNMFPEPLAPDNTFNYHPREENMVIVEWKKITRN